MHTLWWRKLGLEETERVAVLFALGTLLLFLIVFVALGIVPWGWGLFQILVILGVIIALLRYVFARLERRHQALVEEATQVQCLAEVTSTLLPGLTLDDVLSRSVSVVRKLTQAQRVAIHLLAPGDDVLSLGAQHGLDAQMVQELQEVPLGVGTIGTVARSGEPCLSRGDGGPQQQQGVEAAVLPLKTADTLVGTVYLATQPGHALDAEGLQCLTRLGEHIAKAIENARCFDAQDKRAQRLRAINAINREIAAILDPEALLPRVARLLQREFGYYNANIFLRDDDSGDLVLRAAYGGFEDEPPIGRRIVVGQGVVGWVAQTGKPLVIDDITRATPPTDGSTHFEPWEELPWTRSEVAVPIRSGTDVVGVIDLQSTERKHFDEADVMALGTVADQIVVAMQNAKLYQRVQAQLVQLRETQAKLVQATRLATAGELAAGVAHEINNPLTVIMGTAQLIQQYHTLPAEIAEDVQRIVENAQRIANLIRNFTSVGQLSSRQHGPTDINQVVRGAIMDIQNRLDNTAIELRLTLAPDLPLIQGNPTQLQQVVGNLLANAIEAMSVDNDRIPTGRLEVETAHCDNEVIIRVTDTGHGIPPEHLSDVFSPLYTTKVEQGTVRAIGLGLFAAQAVVEAHQGRIEVESKPNVGTTFTVHLPVGPVDVPFTAA